MGNRLSSIVTRTGDTGTTGMADGSRVPKSNIRVASLGEVDELNASIGVAVSYIETLEIRQQLVAVQHDLFDLGAELSQPGKALVSEKHIDAIESVIETLNTELTPLKEFILPGGSPGVAHLHLARTVCRRVERSLACLAEAQQCNPQTQSYINRLSDLLFVMSRYEARHADGKEVYWRSEFSRIKPEPEST